MLYKVTSLMLVLLLCGFLQAQNKRISHQTQPNVALTGDEKKIETGSVINPSQQHGSFGLINSGTLTWEAHRIYDLVSGYDLQSNSSTEQVWYDLNNPGLLHAVFTVSGQASGWTDRTSMYVGSTDNGVTWFELGGVPVNTGTTGHSGYCRISGNSNGSAVIMNHVLEGSPARPVTQLWIDDAPFDYNFTNYSPGLITDPNPWLLWPRFVVDSNDNIIFAASQSANYGTADSFYTNYFNAGSTQFDGYTVWDGDQAETYPFSISEGGLVGQAYIGGLDLSNAGDIWYRESPDGGVTWGASTKIYTRDHSNDTTWGAMRGITLNYYGEVPCIAFETAWQDFGSGQYRQGDANSLYFWSPNVNGGVPKVLIDTSWANWNPGGGANDVMVGVSRPVLARSESGNYLFLAFNAASSNLDPNNDNSPFFDGWFMYSSDGGDTWSDPEKFTPDGPPLMDWRYPSIPQVLPVKLVGSDNVAEVHIVMEGDPIAGSQVQGSASGVTAEFHHFYTEINLGPSAVGDDNNPVNSFELAQNYPNPFNPSTQIKYTIGERSNVSLKVYDVLGNEVANLVNQSQDAGSYNVTFDAANLTSGLYIYKLQAGNFTEAKKMMLLK